KMKPDRILKVKPPKEYPPEEGRYLRGNDFSPVAVVCILNTPQEKIPSQLENLIRYAVESGAALAGLLQTENIGIEKVVLNIISNPNIRFIILCGIESRGHLTGQTFKALIENGVDEKNFIIGSAAPTPYLYNLPKEFIKRFRAQITLIDLLESIDCELLKKGVWSCYQEKPTKFKDYVLCDPGAYPKPPILRKLTWKVTQPWTVVSEEEKKVLQRITEAAKRQREKSKKK
ncbi:MAG: tetrahydromethanopterin S-methyltransferase subunit A, partial [Candidatus Methanofastidiosia archaeon]